MTSVRVGLLAYDGCIASELFTVLDMLRLANRVGELTGAGARFVTSVHAAHPGAVRTSSGVDLHAQGMDRGLDLLIVPGFDLSPTQDVITRLESWEAEGALVEQAHVRGVPIAGVCLGAFLLAQAGILDGRRATTAWLFAEALQKHYPDVLVDRRSLLVEDGPVMTTGAFSAGSDLALHLVRLHVGRSVARQTARITLTGNRNSQAPYIDEQLIDRSVGAFSAEVRHYLATRVDRPYDLPAVAAAHHVSTRTLLRRFRSETGQTPLDYLQTLRVTRARQLLEVADTSIAEIARAVGYQDLSTFRRLFSSTIGMTPSQYRRTFRRPLP